MDKSYLRKIFKEKRDLLFKNGQLNLISKEISKRIAENEFFKKAKNILLFYPKGSELNILDILSNDEKKFYLPSCKNGEISACPYKKGDVLKEGKYKILEPVCKSIEDISILDIVITPALCADEKLYRLGYGGGYYDRFFSGKEFKAKKIVIVPDEMVLKSLPRDDFDIQCDVLISEKRIIEIKN